MSDHREEALGRTFLILRHYIIIISFNIQRFNTKAYSVHNINHNSIYDQNCMYYNASIFFDNLYNADSEFLWDLTATTKALHAAARHNEK